MHQGRLNIALLCAAWCGAAAAETQVLGMAVRADAVLQAKSEHTRYVDALAQDAVSVQALEGRLNLSGRCVEAWCDGASFVLRPRLYAARQHHEVPGMPDRPSSLAEAYVVQNIGESTQLGAGKRTLGWGPGLLYSPSNRLFPDNGAVSPRREIAGKPMLFASTALAGGGRATVLLANPREQDSMGEALGGAFFLGRAEWQQQSEQLATVGAVAGGGGALAPYLGLYAQRGLGDAFTLGGEVALSRRYTRDAARAALLQNSNALKFDLVVNLRYGLPSGAEVGFELIRNGYAMSEQELANPLIAALPSAASRPGWNRPLHPLVQKRYALLQFTAPSLFGNKRWGVTARTLRGLDRASDDSFAELSWSASDAITLYAGHARSRVGGVLRMTRPVTRNYYLTLESFF